MSFGPSVIPLIFEHDKESKKRRNKTDKKGKEKNGFPFLDSGTGDDPDASPGEDFVAMIP